MRYVSSPAKVIFFLLMMEDVLIPALWRLIGNSEVVAAVGFPHSSDSGPEGYRGSLVEVQLCVDQQG